MTILTAVSIYLGIGMVFGLYVKRLCETRVSDYKNEFKELLRRKEMADSYEEKAYYRASVLWLEDMHKETKKFVELERFMDMRVISACIAILMGLFWLPTIVKVYAVDPIMEKYSKK